MLTGEGGRKEKIPGEKLLRESIHFWCGSAKLYRQAKGVPHIEPASTHAVLIVWWQHSHPPTEDRWCVASSAFLFLLWSKDCTTEKECEWNWKCQLTAQITRWCNHHDKWCGLGLAGWIIGYIFTKGDYVSYFHVLSFFLASLKSSLGVINLHLSLAGDWGCLQERDLPPLHACYKETWFFGLWLRLIKCHIPLPGLAQI